MSSWEAPSGAAAVPELRESVPVFRGRARASGGAAGVAVNYGFGGPAAAAPEFREVAPVFRGGAPASGGAAAAGMAEGLEPVLGPLLEGG